jgi:hypothetical protein
VGIDEETIREYIEQQEEEDKRLAQLNLFQRKERDKDDREEKPEE